MVITCTPLLIYLCIIPFSLINSCFTIPPLSSSDHKGLLVSLHNDVILSNSSRTVWCYSQENFDLAWTYLMKVTGTQCSPMHPTWISSGLPGKRGSLRLWNLYPPKTTSLRKHLSWLSPSLLRQWRRRNSPFRSLARSMDFKNTRGKETLAQQPFIIPQHHSQTNSIMQALNLSGWSSSHSLSKQSSNNYSNTFLWWLNCH